MNTSKVWKINLSKNADINELKEKTTKILEASNLLKIISKNKLVGVKQHFGEKGNEGYIKPEVTKVVLNKIKERLGKPLLIETNTLYHGERSNTYNHLKIAYEHGFNYENVGAPIVIMDGLNGQIQRGVEINGKHFKEVYVASDIPFFDSMIVLSHVKGHIMAGIGGAIKNMAMGLASRAGKLAQHADFKPSLNKIYELQRNLLKYNPYLNKKVREKNKKIEGIIKNTSKLDILNTTDVDLIEAEDASSYLSSWMKSFK